VKPESPRLDTVLPRSAASTDGTPSPRRLRTALRRGAGA
jgi:hypothetical protein